MKPALDDKIHKLLNEKLVATETTLETNIIKVIRLLQDQAFIINENNSI